MKRKAVKGVIVSLFLTAAFSLTVCAQEASGESASPSDARAEESREKEAARIEPQVLRNTTFTTTEQMCGYLGTDDKTDWSVLYLPEVEQYYWNFCEPGTQDRRDLSLNLVSNAYQNLEMFLDNGYLLDYNVLADYAADYLMRKGEADAYYKILTDCLKNPYLLNKPKADVTDTTYNGRDYSAVFDPDYYYDENPDLQLSIGFQPPELLRHFVEKGIMEGRKGSAQPDMDAYIADTDAQIALSSAGAQAPGNAPVVAKYSYSRANYYGKFLGHYDYSAVFEEAEGPAEPAQAENAVDW